MALLSRCECHCADDGVRFKLDEPLGVDETRHLHDGAGWPHPPKHLPVYRCHRWPVLDPCEQDPRSHDVRERGARLVQGGTDDFQAPARLPGRVAGSRRTAADGYRRRSRNTYKRPDANGPGEADRRLERTAGRDKEARWGTHSL